MPVPALLAAAPPAIIAAAPYVVQATAVVYTANIATRVAYRAAEYKVSQASSAALGEIADNTALIASRVYDADEDINLAEAVQRKAGMPDELHLHVNIDDPESSTDERWRASGS